MIKQQYVCDLCGHVHEKADSTRLEVRAVGGLVFPRSRGNYWNPTTLSLDICRDCLEKKGFVLGRTEGTSEYAQEKQNADTLRDKLLDILAEVGVEPQE